VANIFQQYLAPPKSAMDYSAELDQADARRQSLQQNALALAAGQQKFDEQQQAGQRAAQLRAALMGLPQGATDDQRIQAMRGTGTPEGFAAADALSKSLIEQRKGTAAAAKDEADTAQTNLKRDIALHDFHAQKLATVQTPEDALEWAKEGNALGLFTQPGQFMRGVAAIQQAAQSPEAFAKWKAGAMQAGQSIADQMKQQLEQAKQDEAVRQFNVTDNRIRTEGAANRANQVRVTQMVSDRQGDDDTAANIDPNRMAFMVDQALRGDTSVYQNLGRGRQGAANLLALRGAVADEAQRRGLTGADLAAINADYQGQKAGLRTSGTISARIENAASEASQLAPLAIEAGRNVARSGFLPFGRAQVMFNNQTNDPAVNKFATANIGLATAYASAMARGNKPTVTDMEHARDMLSTAKSQDAYEAIVSQMQQEIAAAQAAPKRVRDNLRNEISGKGSTHGSGPASGGKPSLSDIFGQNP
jgi:hypothetical protein